MSVLPASQSDNLNISDYISFCTGYGRSAATNFLKQSSAALPPPDISFSKIARPWNALQPIDLSRSTS